MMIRREICGDAFGGRARELVDRITSRMYLGPSSARGLRIIIWNEMHSLMRGWDDMCSQKWSIRRSPHACLLLRKSY
jgi:hypothetical protein